MFYLFRDETDEERPMSGRSSSSRPHHENVFPDANELLLQQYARIPPAHLIALMQVSILILFWAGLFLPKWVVFTCKQGMKLETKNNNKNLNVLFILMQ